MDNLLTVISSALVSVSLSGVLVFLAKNWISERLKGAIQHEYDQKLETLKAQLQSRNDIEITKLKAELEIAAAERNFRFSKTFDKTAEVIAGTYKRLIELNEAVQSKAESIGMVAESQQARDEAYRQKTREFLEYFRPNKIYLPPWSAQKVLVFASSLHDLVFHSNILEAQQRGQVRDIKLLEKRYKNVDDANEEIPKLLTLLENDFQKVLGFPIEEKAATQASA